MFELIKRTLSLKLSIALALITIPPMVMAAYVITSHQAASLEELALNTAKIAANSGAKMYSAELEAGIDDGLFTIRDLIDPVYEVIEGFDFGDNPRFHTRYDFYTDRVATGVQDKLLESSPDFLFVVGVDRNGYLPTHNSKYTQPLTGDRSKDLSGNRAKRKFSDPVGLAAAKNRQPVLVQEYHRDTGELAWDVSSPIYVRGQHFGGFRVGVSVASLAAHKRSLLIQLSVVFALLVTITVGFIFFMLRRSMRPLESLATLADQISMGEKLDEPIKPATTDEIGRMAKSMNRLRTSLRVAMGELGE
jgi:HAMP domain-containing protein